MNGIAALGPLPRSTETRPSPSRVGRMTSRSPVAEISISSARSATNSESMATGQPGLGASLAGLKGNPIGDEPEEVLFILLVAANSVNERERHNNRKKDPLHGPVIIETPRLQGIFPTVIDSMASVFDLIREDHRHFPRRCETKCLVLGDFSD